MTHIHPMPYYYEIVTTLADVLTNADPSVKRKAQTIIETAGARPTQVKTWLPVVQIPLSEWYFLVNERAAGAPYGTLLLVNVPEVLGLYRNATTETATAVLTAILSVKDFEWAVLQGE